MCFSGEVGHYPVQGNSDTALRRRALLRPQTQPAVSAVSRCRVLLSHSLRRKLKQLSDLEAKVLPLIIVLIALDISNVLSSGTLFRQE